MYKIILGYFFLVDCKELLNIIRVILNDLRFNLKRFLWIKDIILRVLV